MIDRLQNENIYVIQTGLLFSVMKIKEIVQFLVNTKKSSDLYISTTPSKGIPATTTPYSVIIREAVPRHAKYRNCRFFLQYLNHSSYAKALCSLLSYFSVKKYVLCIFWILTRTNSKLPIHTKKYFII